jgi:acyl-CoA synthetase (AMP-forming)/AMP-acid ligase II
MVQIGSAAAVMAASTIYSALQSAAQLYGELPFLHFPAVATRAYADGPVDYTYAQTWAEVESLRQRYVALGVVAGDRVATALDNRAETLLHWFALSGVGASLVPINAELRPSEKAYLIAHSQSVVVVAWDHYHAELQEISQVPVIGPQLDALPLVRSKPEPVAINEKTEVALLYTSGTTGKPKGCMLSNDYVLEVGRQYVGLGNLCDLQPGKERIITPLPLSHMNALCCTPFAMLFTGGCLIQLDRFHASSWWQTVRESGATCLHYLGVMPAILLNVPEQPGDSLAGQVKFGFGAGVDPRHQERFEQRFGFPLIEAWAMTETGAGGWISMHAEPRKLGVRCIGKPLPHMEIRLVDEQDQDVPEGEPGELLVRTRGADPRRFLFSGYFADPAATDAAWAGGWFHTGDVVRRDGQGYYYFVDRRKNVIRRSGENIAAVEVEWSLYQHPAVKVCVALPAPDELRGDEVMALIVLSEGWAADQQTAEALFAHVYDQLVYFKAPGYIAFVDALPMTASQKIQRAEAKAAGMSLLDSAKVIDLRDRKRRTVGKAH